MTDGIVTQKRLKELLNYDPESGVFKWRKPIVSRNQPEIAGYSEEQKSKIYYTRIYIDGEKHYAHRLAWLYVYGVFPEIIDHIDGDGENNRICNLRNTSISENLKNKKLYKSNSSGYHGVRKRKGSSSWRVQIGVDGSPVYLGSYKNLEEAIQVRKNAEIKYGYYSNHGRT